MLNRDLTPEETKGLARARARHVQFGSYDPEWWDQQPIGPNPIPENCEPIDGPTAAEAIDSIGRLGFM